MGKEGKMPLKGEELCIDKDFSKLKERVVISEIQEVLGFKNQFLRTQSGGWIPGK